MLNLVRFVAGRILPDDIEEAEKLGSDAMQWIEGNLLDYAWPGNVREFEQCVRKIMIRNTCRPPECVTRKRYRVHRSSTHCAVDQTTTVNLPAQVGRCERRLVANPAVRQSLLKPLDAFLGSLSVGEGQQSEVGQSPEVLQSDVGDLGGGEVQRSEVGQSFNVLHAGVREAALTQRQPLKLGQFLQVRQAGASDSTVIEFKRLELG